MGMFYTVSLYSSMYHPRLEPLVNIGKSHVVIQKPRQSFYSLKFYVMSFKPSKYQTAVYQHVTNGTGNAVIDAVAGSGKSTTIVEALKLIPSNLKVLFLAFNKAIVEELSIKIGNLPNVSVLLKVILM